MYKVPFKYINKYLQIVGCKNLMSSGNWFDSSNHHSRLNVPWGEEEEALIYDCWISICSLSLLCANNSLFISMRILRDLPQQKNLGNYAGQFPNSYVPTFPWKYFFPAKWERSQEIKGELFTFGEVPILVRSVEVWEQPRAHTPGWPSLRRMHLCKDLPSNIVHIHNC
jgi:hypothetical protein